MNNNSASIKDRINFVQNLLKLITKIPAPVKISVSTNIKDKAPELR